MVRGGPANVLTEPKLAARCANCKRIEEARGSLNTTLHRKTEYATESAHLRRRNRMATMRLKAGVEHRIHGGMRAQVLCHRQGRGILARHSQLQGLEAAQQQIGRHRTQARAIDFSVVMHLGHEFRSASQNAPHGVIVPTEKFCRAMHDEVGAETYG